MEKLIDGTYSHWENDHYGKLALIIIADQFSRNIFRRTAKAFAQDYIGLRIAKKIVEGGKLREYDFAERLFIIMPYCHDENREHTRYAVELVVNLNKDMESVEGKDLNCHMNIKGLQAHDLLVQKFGRYPQRNEVLGRKNTKAEQEHLDGGAERWGQ